MPCGKTQYGVVLYVKNVPNAEPSVFPETIHHNNIVLAPMSLYPRLESARISIAPKARPKRVNRDRKILYPGGGGGINGYDFDRMARDPVNSGELLDALDWSTPGGISRMDDVEDFQLNVPIGK